MAGRNDESWNDIIYDLPIFASEDEPSKRAWKWAQYLHEGGHLTQLDLMRLRGLLEACCEWHPPNDD